MTAFHRRDLPQFNVTLEDVNNAQLDSKHASPDAGGQNIAPTLAWTPWPTASSFAVTCYDPDAPTGSGFWHWVVADLNSQLIRLAPGDEALKSATQFANDLGVCAYMGAAPPPGPAHRFVFTVWALDVERLPIPADLPNAVARFMINQRALATGTATATFGIDN